MKIAIDIDGTVCEELRTYSKGMAKPLPDALSSVNSLYDKGHEIVFYTARSWPEYEMTKDWLDRHGFKYHQLIMGKLNYDVFIDDRSIRFESWDKIKLEQMKK